LENEHVAVAKLLIEKGADVNAKDKYDIPPLHKALEKGLVDIAKLLIDKGADINAKCKHDRTSLHFAAYNGLKDMVELLLAKGADTTVRTTDGDCYNCTPLDWAKVQNKTEIVEILRSK
jgi:ankyrin repeat protein